MTDFTTKLDSSSNRQLKQYRDTTMQLSGSTQFGIPDYLIPVSTATTINIDALQYIQSRGYILATDPIIIYTGVTTVLTRGSDGIIVNTPTTGFTGGVSGTTDNDWVSGGTFNTGSGDLTLTRVSGGTVVTNLDGRYVTGSTATGLEILDEGNGDGWRLIGRDASLYGGAGLNSIDFGYNTITYQGSGATGTLAFNHGQDNILSGFGSVGFGSLINSSGSDSFNVGINLKEVGFTNSLFGIGHSATTMNCTVVGQAANIITEQTSDFNFTPTKALFVVGNGTITNSDFTYTVLTRSDAFMVRMNGEIIAPSTTISVIDSEATGKQLVTREWIESTITNTQKNINGNYTILSGDNNTLLVLSATSAFNITTNSGLTDNFQVEFINIGTSTVTFLTSGTANLNFPDGTIFLPNKVSMLVKIGSTNNYWLKGELE